MKQQLLSLLLLMYFAATATAQITPIPDPAFEQELIDLNIDSDGIVNGQVLTSDVEDVTELSIEVNLELTDLTGIESFTNLEELTVTHTMITELDLTHNVNLKKLYCGGNMLTSINVSTNLLLEELDVSNSDTGFPNQITELDLSNCPNIRDVYAIAISELTRINLKNGNNNPDMHIDVSMWFGDGPPNPDLVLNTVCIEVDNEELAQANQFPYSEWNVNDTQAAHFFTESCSLNTPAFKANEALSVYPNPASDTVHIDVQGITIEKAELYDTAGRMVREYNNVTGSILLSGIAPGTYIIKALTADGSLTGKVIVQ